MWPGRNELEDNITGNIERDGESQKCVSHAGSKRRWWGLTFDMSGGARGAERPLRCPLDGRVRPRCCDECLLRARRTVDSAMPSGREAYRSPLLAHGPRT